VVNEEIVSQAGTGPLDLDEKIDVDQLGQLIRQMAETLTPKQRIVFILRDIQDLSVEEVSNLLLISKEAVKSNLFHARKKIRKRIEKLNLI
jgi:RNA polymerase sigma-70 factor (ECF subfamily)